MSAAVRGAPRPGVKLSPKQFKGHSSDAQRHHLDDMQQSGQNLQYEQNQASTWKTHTGRFAGGCDTPPAVAYLIYICQHTKADQSQEQAFPWLAAVAASPAALHATPVMSRQSRTLPATCAGVPRKPQLGGLPHKLKNWHSSILSWHMRAFRSAANPPRTPGLCWQPAAPPHELLRCQLRRPWWGAWSWATALLADGSRVAAAVAACTSHQQAAAGPLQRRLAAAAQGLLRRSAGPLLCRSQHSKS